MDDIGSAPRIPSNLGNPNGRQSGYPSGRRASPAAPVHRGAEDVLGAPDASFPQSAEQSIAALVAEVERLRHEVEMARHFEAFLGEEADRHPVLPVLNRRALLRALGQLLVASEQAEFSGSLIYIHIGGVERLRLVHGLAASDAALLHAARVMQAELRQTDLIGYLDSGDFAIALALADAYSAEDKARALTDRLVAEPLEWQGASYGFTPAFGLAHFHPERSAEETLHLADAVRRGLARPDGSPADPS